MSEIPYLMLLLLTIVMPLIYNEGQAWWLPLLSLVLTVTFILWALPIWWLGRLLPSPVCSWSLLLFLLPLAISLIQLIPDFPGMDLLSPTTLRWWQEFNATALIKGDPTLTIAPDATVERSMLFGLCGLFLFLLTNVVRTNDRLKGLLLAICFACVGNAFLAYFQMCFPASHSSSTILRGVFLNRNHFAFLMLLGTMSTLSLLTIVSSHRQHELPSQYTAFSWSKLAIPLELLLFVLLTAQVTSLSRGAFIASAVAILLFALLWLLSPHSMKREKKQIILAYGTILILALAFGLYYSLNKLSLRYASLSKQDFTMDARWLVWQDSVKLIFDNWQVGVGQGAYPYAIQLYDSGNFPNNLIIHAHNDFLELAAEIGLPAMALLLLIAIALFVGAAIRAWHYHDRTKRWAALGSLITIVAALSHEVVEFNLQAWANLFVFTAVIGTVATATFHRPRSMRNESQEPDEHTQPPTLTSHRIKRLTVRLPWLLLAIGAIYLIPAEIDYLKSGISQAKLTKDLQKGYVTSKPRQVDYARRIKMLKDAQHPLLSQHYLLKEEGMLAATLAEDTPEAVKFSLLETASKALATAAAHMPTDGTTAYYNAYIQDIAKLYGASTISSSHLEKLYDWALKCQPNVVPMLEKVGMKALQSFLDAYGQDDKAVLEHHKNRARAILLHALQLQPNDKNIFNALFYLYGNTSELLHVAPQNLATMSTLAAMLVEHKRPSEALVLAHHILEKHRQQLTRQQLIETYSIITAAQAILQLQDERQTSWKQLWNVIRTKDYLDADQLRELEDKTPRETLSILKDYEKEVFLNDQHLVRKARTLTLMGRQNDAILTLLQLSYYVDAPPSNEIIREALDILNESNDYGNDFVFIRATFLRCALQIMLAERTGSKFQLTEAINRLTDLQTRMSTQRRPWINRHLISIYKAKALIVFTDVTQAAESLREALDICPNNIFAINLLAEYAPHKLMPWEKRLLGLLNHRFPIARFASGLTWYATKFSDKTIANRYQKQTVTYVFSCHNDILRPIQFRMAYMDKEGTMFYDRIKFPRGQEMTFRIGEIIKVEHSWQPYVNTLSQTVRIITDGPVVVKALEKAYPTPCTYAFNVDLTKDAKQTVKKDATAIPQDDDWSDRPLHR